MSTNVLLLPIVELEATVFNNAGWYDQVAILSAGVALPLDGIALHGQLRSRYAANPLVALDLTTANGRLTNSGATGIAGFYVGADLIGELQPGDYVFDVLAAADGVTLPFIRGTIHLLQGVTR